MKHFLISYFLLIPSPILVFENNQAVDSLAKKDKQVVATVYFTNQVQEMPDNFLALWNLSQAFVMNEQFDSAHKLLDYMIKLLEADTNLDPMWLFFAYYNKAQVYVAQKNNEAAIDYYIKALDIVPSSKEVVVNLELLIGSGGEGGGEGQEEEPSGSPGGDQDKPEEDNKDSQEETKQRPKPQTFDSKDLSRDDVRRILDELKRQEEKIREKLENDQQKESSNAKDW